MDSETRQLLLESITLSRENNKMLKSLYTAQRWTRVFAFVKLIVGLGVAYGAYVFLEPYLKNLSDMFSVVMTSMDGFKNFKPF